MIKYFYLLLTFQSKSLQIVYVFNKSSLNICFIQGSKLFPKDKTNTKSTISFKSRNLWSNKALNVFVLSFFVVVLKKKKPDIKVVEFTFIKSNKELSAVPREWRSEIHEHLLHVSHMVVPSHFQK